jgi:hypothetical protein
MDPKETEASVDTVEKRKLLCFRRNRNPVRRVVAIPTELSRLLIYVERIIKIKTISEIIPNLQWGQNWVGLISDGVKRGK